MWTTREREDLAVWADAQQQRGEPWGELVATSLAHASSPTPELAERLAQLQREVFEPSVAPLLRTAPHLHPRWEHGVLVGLHIAGDHDNRAAQTLAAARALLSLPCARFVWRIWVSLDWNHHDAACRMLLDERVVARPRMLHVGEPRWRKRRQLVFDTNPGFYGALAIELGDIARGLLEFTNFDARFELPSAPGDAGSRLAAFRRLATRIERCEGGLPPLERTLLGRSLWDRSLRVRLEALELLELLGAEAAMFVPGLVMQHVEDPRWLSARDEVLAKLAEDAALVERVATHVEAEHHLVLPWLARIGALDDRVLDRVEAMLAERSSLPGWLVLALQTLLHRHRPPKLLPRPLSESAGTWFDRLRTWLRGE